MAQLDSGDGRSKGYRQAADHLLVHAEAHDLLVTTDDPRWTYYLRDCDTAHHVVQEGCTASVEKVWGHWPVGGRVWLVFETREVDGGCPLIETLDREAIRASTDTHGKLHVRSHWPPPRKGD